MSEHDYDLSQLEQIKVRGLKYFIMPRYKDNYLNHDYEDFSLDIMLKDLKEDSTLVDIGSHYGIYSLLAGKKANRGKMIAFEPVPENFTILNKNIKANKVSNVTAYNYATSDSDGEAEFNIPWASDSAGFYEHPNAETIRKLKVRMVAPDSVLKSKKVDFIKIDTEGHELHVLDGLKETLIANPQAKLLIELNPECLLRAGCTATELIKKIDGLGKAVLIVDEDKRRLINITGKPNAWEEYVGKSGYANIYCVPKKEFSYVMFVSHSAKPGGAEKALLELVEDLRKENVIPHFIVPEEGEVTVHLKENGIGYDVIPYGGWAHFKKLSLAKAEANDAWNMKAVQEIYDLAKTISPDVIFSNTIVLPWGGLTAKALGIPHVWMIHEYGNLDHHLIFDYGYERTLKTVGNLSDKVLANSPNIMKHLSTFISKDKLHQVTMRFLPEQIEKMAKVTSPRIFSQKAEVKLILTGSIKESKGQIDAVKAVAFLKDNKVRAELALVGGIESSSYKKELDRVIKEFGIIDEIKFIGHVKNPMPYVKQADLALVCSAHEAFGRVTVEAMLLAKPIIGSNTGATPYILGDSGAGLLYSPGDWQDLGQKILKIIKSKKDLEKLGRQAYKRAVDVYSSDEGTKKLTALILDLKGKPRKELQLFYDKFINQSRVQGRWIKDLGDEKNQLEIKLEQLQSENESIKRQLDDIKNSKAWRIADQMRKGKYQLSKVAKRKK